MKQDKKRSGRYSIAPTLVFAIGSLAILSVGSILAVQYFASTKLVATLGNQLIERNIQFLELALSGHLDAAEKQGAFIEKALRGGAYRIDGEGPLPDFIAGSLAAAPQINGIIVATPDNQAVRAFRTKAGEFPSKDLINFENNPQTLKIAEETRSHRSAYWGAPEYAEGLGQAVLNYRIPLWTGEEYDGFIAIGVGTKALADLTREFSDPPLSTVFVNYGHEYVIAAPGSEETDFGLNGKKPLVPLSELDDPVLSNLSKAVPFVQAGLKGPPGAQLSQLDTGEGQFLIITKNIAGYGDTPLVIGAYSPLDAVDGPLRLLTLSLIIGFFLLLISIGSAIALSRFISRPIRRTAKEARKIGTFEFDKIDPLSGSFLSEINDLAVTFNTMLEGVKSFGRYVPKSLVQRLIQEKRVGAGTEERDLTVMFTDIADFTTICEGMSTQQVADFINHHLTLVVGCIEREGGTVDKYIGDAVMAFWGAPDHIEDAPARACRAALAIQDTIRADNRARIANGKLPVHMRIGIHRGPLIVGDIGAPERINYTVVGDVVNAAQRLESLGKEIDPEAEIIILASTETVIDSGLQDKATHQGAYTVKGKEMPLDVYRLQ